MSVYADSYGTMELVGPKGWRCTASYGADGSGGMAIYPHGQALPGSWTANWKLKPDATTEAIVGIESSACYTCTLALAARLFTTAARTLNSYLGRRVAATSLPAGESVVSIGTGIEGFTDPPGLYAAGQPSGGQDLASGVLTYHPHSDDGSWLETCTLPGGDKAVCTATLSAFVSWYGQQ